jgi:hypothetical protein
VTYRPGPEAAEVLAHALREINSVPYEVPLRWTFYQVVQRYGFGKDRYDYFKRIVSKARKEYYAGWRPDTLIDETRWIDQRGKGHFLPAGYYSLVRNAKCELDVRARQPNSLLVLFEAAAMRRQFDHYLGPLRISSSPLQGDASIPHKWNIAKWIDERRQVWPEKPVVILYFGDYDPKGLEIPWNAISDIWEWVERHPPVKGADKVSGRHSVGFESEDAEKWFRWVRVGINADQVGDLGIAENPEKPGTYQWEALPDERARKLILGAVGKYWDSKIVEQVERSEGRIQRRWQREFDAAFPERAPISSPPRYAERRGRTRT